MKFIEKLCAAYGPLGNEEAVCDIIAGELENVCDSVATDVIGNLICEKKGGGKKIMLLCHTDEPALMVTHIEKDGFLRCAPVGGISLKNQINRRVRLDNGTLGIVSVKKDEKNEPAWGEAFIDIGAADEKEAEEKVKIGSLFTLESEFIKTGKILSSKALSSRLGCFALCEAAKKVKSENDLYFVFASQSEAGSRGAFCAAARINPDIILGVGACRADDVPGEDGKIKLGGGPVISLMDKGFISSERVTKLLYELTLGKPCQSFIGQESSSDAGAAALSGTGALWGALLIPVRYKGTDTEAASYDDVLQTADLIKAFAERA